MTAKVVKSFRDLDVWKKGMQLAKAVYVCTKKFPSEEIYGLTSQMRRAAVSIPSNIAEGHARGSTKEYLNFVSIAQGSCAELETQVILSCEFGYMSTEGSQQLLELIHEVSRMSAGLHASLKAKTDNKKR